jgi:4-hydroxy-tetrahydrodipicolinate synthase
LTGYAFPRHARRRCGQRDTAHDLFDAHLPLIRYEQQQGIGLAARKYVPQKRSAIAYDSQRASDSSLTAKGRAEVGYLLSRLAQHDPRAKTPPRT